MTIVFSLAPTIAAAPWRLSLVHGASKHRFFWITKGQARALVGPRRMGIGVHSFLSIPAEQPFSLDPATPVQGIGVEIDANDPSEWPLTAEFLRVRDVDDQNELSRLVDALFQEFDHSRLSHDLAIRAYTRLCSIWFARQMLTQDIPNRRSTASDRLISAFLDMLERHYSEGLSMAEYAERLDMTPTHLSRVCKTQLGRSAAALITDRTLHAARHELETTTRPAKQIAADLGFGSAAYFSRFVLSHTGANPRALRANARRAAA